MHTLIIEGFRPAHEILKEMGIEITLLIEEFRISGNEKGFYDRYFTVSNNAELDEWLQQVDKINEISRIDKVINFHENRQYETAIISRHLGIEYYNVRETRICKDKLLMRSFLNETGIDSVLSGKLEHIGDYLSSGKIKFPLIIKPYNDWASKNIFKVTNEIELNTACNICKNDDEYKVYCFEKYIDGEEFSVETFSQFGIHKVIAVTKKFKNDNFVERGHCIPANLEYTRFNCIRDKVIEFLCGINHMNGPMHTEIIITKDQKVHIVESHLRMGGDNIPDLIKIVSDFDLLTIWCKQICDGNINLEAVPEITINNTNGFWL